MSDTTKLSHTAAIILQTVDQGLSYGFDVMDATGLPSGTVYPALRRMETAGLVRSKWESPPVAQREQRPPPECYDITRSGQLALAEAVERYRLAARPAPSTAKPSPAKS